MERVKIFTLLVVSLLTSSWCWLLSLSLQNAINLRRITCLHQQTGSQHLACIYLLWTYIYMADTEEVSLQHCLVQIDLTSVSRGRAAGVRFAGESGRGRETWRAPGGCPGVLYLKMITRWQRYIAERHRTILFERELFALSLSSADEMVFFTQVIQPGWKISISLLQLAQPIAEIG